MQKSLTHIMRLCVYFLLFHSGSGRAAAFLQTADSTASVTADSTESVETRPVYSTDWSWLAMGQVAFLDSVTLYDPGAPGAGTGGEPDPAFQNSAMVLGPPDYDGQAGMACFGAGGTMILEFKDNVFFEGAGPDLCFWMPDSLPESVMVWVSQDGMIFKEAGTVSSESPLLDLSGIMDPGEFYSVLKLRGDVHSSPRGACLDAVAALHTATIDIFPVDSLFDEYTLHPSASRILNSVTEKMRMYPRSQILIEVYGENAGTAEYSLLLSQERAKAIRDYLKYIAGLTAYRYSAVGLGRESRFFDPFRKRVIAESVVVIIIYKG